MAANDLAIRLTAGLLALAGIVLAAPGIPDRLDALLVAVGDGPSPYFDVSQALLLNVWVPLVAVAAGALFLAPGLLLLAPVRGREERFELWVAKGLTLSLFAVPALAALAQRLSGVTLVGVPYIVLVLLLCVPGLLRIAARGAAPVLTGRGPDIAVMIGLPFLVVALMAPKFYWENFNDDGAHSYLSSILFITRGLPFWPPGDSSITGYPAMTMLTEAMLQTGITRFFGPHEAALRFAFLPGVAVLAAVILGYLRDVDGRTPGAVAIGVGAQLLLFSFVFAFNPSYSAYFADIALPMTREPLILIGFLAGVLFFFEGRLLAMAAVASLGLLSAPNGLLLFAFFLPPYFLLTRPLPWGRTVAGGMLVLGVVVAATLAMQGLDAAHITQSSGEFGRDGILDRLRFVTLDDTQRILFWLLPAGLLPGLALLAWPWQDRLSRILTLTVAIYVLFFYVQAYRILPHHFAPAAVIPMVVFWRLAPVTRRPAAGVGVALAGVAVAVWIGWPGDLGPNQHSRDLGSRVAIEVPIDPVADPGSLGIFTGLMEQAFAPAWTDADLAKIHAVEPTATYVYARRRDPAAPADYAIRPATVPLVAGETLLGEPVQGAVLVVLNPEAYARDRDGAGRPVSIAPALRVRRDTIFGHGVYDPVRRVWDLARLAGLR
ncbi:MAG: hypothetical protein KDE00_15205 [Rhodobacteraceae bacterium]|nr:hypothetical protein [Paracoccaceae bacterium]